MTTLSALPRLARRYLSEDVILGLARQLIQVPSFTPEGEDVTDVTERHQVDDVGVNVTARLPGVDGSIGLLLNGHLDTVPPSSAMPYPPFAAEISADKLWGRGAVDMKGGLAAMACAVAAVHTADLPLRRPLALVACTRPSSFSCASVRTGST